MPIEDAPPTTLSAVDLRPCGRVFPSPVSWRDQIIYALLIDRFSDGREAERPLYDRTRPDRHRTRDKRGWMAAGRTFEGGTLTGIRSKLDYLQGLATTLWVSPPYRQRRDLETYHGYAVQNFLDVDPRFGTRQDLRDLVDAAHDRGMYVLLDVAYNHTGNNWFYDDHGSPKPDLPYRWGPPYPVHGWRSRDGTNIVQIASLDDGVWPSEFQDFGWYVRAGRIERWEPEPWEEPLHPDNEFRRGDFFELKKLALDRSDVLSAVIKVYQYWIALTDCDGFRIDAVKHISWRASRNFCGAIREYAESIGKENFLLVGEVTGGSGMARHYIDPWRRQVDAVLDIGDAAMHLTEMVKGRLSATTFFALFSRHDALGDPRETGVHHVSIVDDHDMVGRPKHRFCARNRTAYVCEQVAHATGVQLTTIGIPCIEYGTEQAFDGTEDRHDPSIDSGFLDRYLRETMFGGRFGAFETAGCHFFDPRHPTYRRIAAIARVRQQKSPIGLALRRGRQYLRETSSLDRRFALPEPGELISWSRILHDREVLVALNTHGVEARGAYVTLDASLHRLGTAMTFLYRGDWSDAELRDPPTDQMVPVECRDGRAVVRIDLPPAGMAILA